MIDRRLLMTNTRSANGGGVFLRVNSLANKVYLVNGDTETELMSNDEVNDAIVKYAPPVAGLVIHGNRTSYGVFHSYFFDEGYDLGSGSFVDASSNSYISIY